MSACTEPPSLTKRISRAERWRALGVLLGALALAYGVLIHPWWTVPMLRLGDELAVLRERDARIRALLGQEAQIQATLAQLQADHAGADAPGFMPEANVQLATAALVQRLENAVRAASPGNRSCAVLNRTPLTEPSAERFPRAAVQVRLACGNAELGRVLHALESGHPRLFVDHLSVFAQRRTRLASSGSGGGVEAGFELYGYLAPRGASIDGP